MNVGIFNRVNFKSKDSDGMYSEWTSLPLEGGGHGVLGAVGGRDVVLAVVKQLASHQPSPLTTDTEVEWVLEVVRYGLALPLGEHEALRACVRVCCAWLGALLPPAPAPMPPPPVVPPPLQADPRRYAARILSHLHNLFVPRPDDSADLISKQAVLCHRVLRLARSLADSAALGPREWRALLLLLLAAAASLLAPPAPHHGAADQLCERVLCVLFEVWILACHRCFPSPALWRTLREQCVRWRHRAPLTEQWARASLCLTARLLAHMYGPLFPAMPVGESHALAALTAHARHRAPLTEQGTCALLCLTARLLAHMYGPLFPAMPVGESHALAALAVHAADARHRAPLSEQGTCALLCLTACLLAHMYGPLFPAMPVGESYALAALTAHARHRAPLTEQGTCALLCLTARLLVHMYGPLFPAMPVGESYALAALAAHARHHAPLTEQGTCALLCLTARLPVHMCGPLFPAMPVGDEDANLVPADMSAEAVMQTWYRILHTIGNPVDLCRPHIISQTPEFLQYSMTAEEGARDPSAHPCLQALPSIFLKAMKGIAAHVDAFLGRGTERWRDWCGGAGGAGTGGVGGAGGAVDADDELTPPAHRRLAKSFSVASRPRDKLAERSTPRTSLIGLTGSRPSSVVPTTPPNSISSQVDETEKPPLTPLRPKVNSILHLFGEWLFEAALIGTTSSPNYNQQRAEGTPPPPSLSDATYRLNMMSYQPGRAVALGALCRVVCSKQCREEVLAPYLARTYAALRRGLRDPATAAAVVLHAHHMLRLDLDGVLVLVPDFITALDLILSEREPKIDCTSIDKRELRKAAISLLLSLVAFPYHYRGLAVPEFPGCNEYGGMTIGEYARGRLSLICVSAVQVETSEALAVPLLSALYLCVLHNAYVAPAHSPPSATSHSTDYRARSDEGAAGERAQDDFAADVRELDPTSPAFGAALVVRATYLVCHRLISSWKGDLQVSLAALELLSGFAKLHSVKPEFVIEAVERKRAVRWICDYIAVQCGRPPQAHSRDLHSCVVAAYQCLAAWLCPALLADQHCLTALMEVVELGISGSKSQGKPGEPPKMKDEKELKPVSMRVRDAAESLLMLILEQGAGARGCRLDERWLEALGHGRLRHFAADGAALLALLEEPLANSQEPQPTLVVIIRCAWGRYAWSLSSRGAPRCATRGATACARPVPMLEPPARAPPTCLPLPAAPPCAVDSAFPSLEAVLRQLNDPDAPTLFKLLEQQAAIEKRVKESEDNVTPEEYVPPEPVTEFQTARLFLSHFGYLNIGGDKKGGNGRLCALDAGAAGLGAALRRLDAASARAALTVHVMYARAGQRVAHHIVANAHARDLAPAYVHMLRGSRTFLFLIIISYNVSYVAFSYSMDDFCDLG
ncbi:unnamed protein product [Parnassius apollo]|uniref:(apollo) hypothetical protein n=1 Tax=Parnassius apollo TaxID=110799 RepID=A0A8S3WEZ2_PARAO|nr:unnamed protein product [Parnassius apollo]